jgi:hypothetical protein
MQGNFLYLSQNRVMGMISSMRKKANLCELFPEANDTELDQIADILHGYCAAVWQIYEHLERKHPDVIDALMKSRSMKLKVDSPQIQH